MSLGLTLPLIETRAASLSLTHGVLSYGTIRVDLMNDDFKHLTFVNASCFVAMFEAIKPNSAQVSLGATV